jgi:NADH-quinone oxidoreductase subunit J
MNPFPASDLILTVIFGLAAAATVAGALIATLTRRIIRSVCGLALCCVGLAGLYYFLRSPFLALMEILIYVGAVCVTIIFAVMLAEPEEAVERDRPLAAVLWGGAALLVSGVVFWGLTRLGLQGPWDAALTRVSDGSVAAIGIALLTTYSLAFELVSLVLLVAILGALVIARGGRARA